MPSVDALDLDTAAGRKWLALKCGLRRVPHTSDMRTMVDDMFASGYRPPPPEIMSYIDSRGLQIRPDRVYVLT